MKVSTFGYNGAAATAASFKNLEFAVLGRQYKS